MKNIIYYDRFFFTFFAGTYVKFCFDICLARESARMARGVPRRALICRLVLSSSSSTFPRLSLSHARVATNVQNKRERIARARLSRTISAPSASSKITRAQNRAAARVSQTSAYVNDRNNYYHTRKIPKARRSCLPSTVTARR